MLSAMAVVYHMPMQTLTLADNQEVIVTAAAEDAAGNPASNFNPALWASSANAIASIANISENGLTATIVAGQVGTATITVTGQQGNGLPQFTTQFSVTVTAGVPTQFVFTFGTPTAQG
jgi:uncharacterized protein YjdB